MMKTRLLTAAIFFAAVNSAQAAEWVMDFSASPSFEYDDNVLLAEDEQGSSIFRITPTVILSRAVDRGLMSVDLGYAVERFQAIQAFDAENPFIRFSSDYALERMQLGLQASYVEDNVRNNAFEDTGNFSTNAISRTRSISPSMQYQLSERDTLTTSLSYLESLFSSDDFTDNKTKSLSIGWRRQLTERFSGGLNSSVTNFKNEGRGFSSDDNSYGLSTAISYQMTEIWLLNADMGFFSLSSERTDDTTGLTEKGRDTGPTVNITSAYSGELDTITIGYSRQIAPSGLGAPQEFEGIDITAGRKLSETLTANLKVSYRETRAASEQLGSQSRDNINISPSLRWQVDSQLAVNLSYSYRQQKSDDREDVDSNAVTMTLNYDWDGYRVSR